jgi:uncharacterized protein
MYRVSIYDKIQEAMKEAMRAKDQVRLTVTRMTKAALKNREIEKKAALSKEEEQKIVASLVKQRRDSADQFRKGDRLDLAQKEEAEIEFLETLLPPPLTDAEVEDAIDRVIQETGACGNSDFGKVMKPVMGVLAGRADGTLVKQLVQKKLSA